MKRLAKSRKFEIASLLTDPSDLYWRKGLDFNHASLWDSFKLRIDGCKYSAITYRLRTYLIILFEDHFIDVSIDLLESIKANSAFKKKYLAAPPKKLTKFIRVR